MKKTVILAAVILCATVGSAQELKTFKDSLSYAVGVLWGQNIKQQGITEINSPVMGQAIDNVLAGEETMIDIASANQLLRKFLSKEKEAQKSRNKAEGEAFLKKNAEREGVVTLPSGLQYEVLKEGTGPVPKSSDKVKVHYHGTLINGDVFDSSVQRGQPASFPVTGVIKGWVEALQLMPVGSKWKLFIPSNLAYGERGAGGKIGPNAALVFEVELLAIE
ncbi:MAG TPA: FKBP-type peptidyl-prolyl cis-trans isomerase [Bacteroidetes bacterium]|nr:FKBP-type peptidyl-prolyl cis-trans isomerase [Bacteroidota bacterium]